MRKVIETDNYVINYPDTLEEIANYTIKLLEEKTQEYEDLFKIKFDEKVIVNYFDTINDFREFIYELRGERESLSSYAGGTYDKGMINSYIPLEMQSKRKYMAAHELFHIFYAKYVLKNDYSKRIVWYDEGMAQFISGEKNKLEDLENFKKFYLKVKENTHVVPEVNELVHGDKFRNKDYDGYALTYLAVRYLYENLDHDEFKNLIYDLSGVLEYGNNLLPKVFEYFDQKIKYKSR